MPEQELTIVPVTLHFESKNTSTVKSTMLYKRLDNGKFQWPKDENEIRNLTL